MAEDSPDDIFHQTQAFKTRYVGSLRFLFHFLNRGSQHEFVIYKNLRVRWGISNICQRVLVVQMWRTKVSS